MPDNPQTTSDYGIFCPACNRKVVFVNGKRIILHEGNGHLEAICTNPILEIDPAAIEAIRNADHTATQ